MQDMLFECKIINNSQEVFKFRFESTSGLEGRIPDLLCKMLALASTSNETFRAEIVGIFPSQEIEELRDKIRKSL